jgi:DNA-binding CsgD family transcriptional regulator
MSGARLINATVLKEGELMNKVIESRMIRKNKNFLNATLGSTGSGKSYFDLAVVNSWYLYNFKKPFPVETNCCFSIGELMKRLSDKNPKTKLVKGEILIFEEAGANMGSLDFQTRTSKIFGYVLQSFRSLNIGILFNLPTESMLNKNARLLLHSIFVMESIDFKTNKSSAKVFFRQTNVTTGKCYNKYLRAKVFGRVRTVKKFFYSMPPKDIIDSYETKKLRFVSELNESFSKELDEIDKEAERKMGRKNLTNIQQEVFELVQDGKNVQEIAEIRESHQNTIYEIIKNIKKKGFTIKIRKNTKKNQGNPLENPNDLAI